MPDLATILTEMTRKGPGVTFRQGIVVAWAGGTSNTVTVGGADIDDLPYLDGVSCSPADVVALLRCANTWLVIGRIVKPTG